MVPLILYGRKRLFSLINDLPTVFEVVTERKPVKDKPTADSGSKSRGSTKVSVVVSVCDTCIFYFIFLVGSSEFSWFILRHG